MLADNQPEKRQIQRRRTLRGGRIVFNLGRSTIDCTVRNVSPRGAKLQVASSVGIPETFTLKLDEGTSQHCRVVWRTLKEIGVAFHVAH